MRDQWRIFSNNIHPSFLHHLSFWWTFYEDGNPSALLINLTEAGANSNQFVPCSIKSTINRTVSSSRMKAACGIDLTRTLVSHIQPTEQIPWSYSIWLGKSSDSLQFLNWTFFLTWGINPGREAVLVIDRLCLGPQGEGQGQLSYQ